MGRPIIGLYIFVVFTNVAYQQRKMNILLAATLLMSLLISFLSLTSTQWNSKSDSLLFVIDLLPTYTSFPGAEGGFNANELAGALTFIVPMAAGLMVWNTQMKDRGSHLLRWGFGATFVTTLLALFLGQSRFGLLGALGALVLLVPLVLQSARARWAAWASLAAIAILEILIVRSAFSPTQLTQQAERDEDSMSGRFDIWKSVLDILRDYEWTGVGLNMFRDGRVRAQYPVPTFKQPVLPHTHNELLQYAADMGIPGIALFIGWYASIAHMLWQTYRRGDRAAKVLAASVGAGLLAHAIFGFGDAVPQWDRLGFISWTWLGLVSAQYVLTTKPAPANDLQSDNPLPAES